LYRSCDRGLLLRRIERRWCTNRIAKDRTTRDKHEQRLLANIGKLSRRIANKKLVKLNKINQAIGFNKINQAIGCLNERYPRVARLLQTCPRSADRKLQRYGRSRQTQERAAARRLLPAQNQPQGPLGR
jgi:hypothetical protein